MKGLKSSLVLESFVSPLINEFIHKDPPIHTLIAIDLTDLEKGGGNIRCTLPIYRT